MTTPATQPPASEVFRRGDAFGRAAAGLLVADLDGEITSINPAMAELFGLAPAAVTGANLLALLDPPDQICDLLESLIASGIAPEREISLDAGAGQRRIVLSAALLPAWNAAGKQEFLAAGRPLDAEPAVAAAPATLDDTAMVAAAARVGAMVAHDLNNVLGVMLGTCHLLATSPHDAAAASRDLDALVAASSEAALIVRQLAAYGSARPSTPMLLRPDDALRRLAPAVSRLLASTVHLDLGTDGGTLLGDPAVFDDIVLSLALEARRTLGTSDRVTLHLTTSGTGAEWRLRLSTVAPDTRRRPAAPAGGRSDGRRLGGIAIERWIAEQGGRLEVDGLDGETHLLWPRRVEAQPPQPVPSAPEPGRPQGAVLVVDDNVRLREFVQRVLASHGYQVEVAANGSEALAAIAARRFDAVVTDILMPDISGWEVGAAVTRRDPACGVVYVTGELVDGDGVEARAGDCQLLLKPFTTVRLLDTVARACARPATA